MPDGTACFIDANILCYHFIESPRFSPLSSDCLKRVAAGAIAGYGAVQVIAEASHKIMLAEAAATFGLNRPALVNWLQRHSKRITELRQFRQAAKDFPEMGLSILPADTMIIPEAARLSTEWGLLTNDALILPLMQRHGVTHLVTNDDDFDAVPNLTIWKPR